jgi:hypothetical protein
MTLPLKGGMDDSTGFADPRESNFICDGCYAECPDEQANEVDGPGGWTMCAVCAARHAEGPDPMNGVEFPFADNH